MKGKVNIKLFDESGKLKKEIEKENLITNAIERILYPDFPSYFDNYNSRFNPLKNYTPIANNLIGGILLFNSSRTEDVEHILPTAEDLSSYIGNAGDIWTGTSDKVKGTLNANESEKLENGYKFVWNFGTGKSFNLSSLSLTSRDGGNIGLDFDLSKDTKSNGSLFKGWGTNALTGLNNPVEAANNLITNITNCSVSNYGQVCYISEDYKTIILGTLNSSNNTYTLNKFRYVDKIRINDSFPIINNSPDILACTNWELETTHTVIATLTLSAIQYLSWDNDYIHSFNISTSGTTMTVKHVKINVSDFTSTETSFSVEVPTTFSSSTYYKMGNKLLVNDYTKNYCIYVVDLDTQTLIRTIPYVKYGNYNYYDILKLTDSLILLLPYYSYNKQAAILMDINTGTVFYSQNNGNSFGTNRMNHFRILNSVGNSPVFICESEGNYNKFVYITANIFTCYFASILNLDETISKAESDTLKITYTITNE